MSLLSSIRRTLTILPDILMREAGAAFGVFTMVWLPPLLFFTSNARRLKRAPFHTGYVLRVIILCTGIIAGGIFFTGRTVTSSSFVLGLLDMTVGINRVDAYANFNRAAEIISNLPDFTLEDELLTADVPEAGLTLYDPLLYGGQSAKFIHITNANTTGDALFPGSDDHDRPTIILHKTGMSIKKGKEPYEERDYATLERIRFGETQALGWISDVTPPSGGYSMADVLRLLSQIAKDITPTRFFESEGLVTAINHQPGKAGAYTLPGANTSPTLYIDVTPAAAYPGEESTFLIVLTDKLLFWRARTDDPFTPVFLPSLNRAQLYQKAGDVMRAAQHALTYYFWPIAFPLFVVVVSIIVFIPAILAGYVAGVVTKTSEMQHAYTGGAALCFIASVFYAAVFSFADLWNMHVTLALGVLFYMILCYRDYRAYQRTQS